MQELSITYPTSTQIKKEEGKKIKERYSMLLPCLCVHVCTFNSFLPPHELGKQRL